jgi:lycopene cyclase domain-containing protein
MAGLRNGRVWVGIAVHVILAVLYTTPWDNYLVATGVWYYNPELVTGLVLGYVPIEEYTFFVLETILAGLWWWFLARRIAPSPGPSCQTAHLHCPQGAFGSVPAQVSQSREEREGFTADIRLVFLSSSVPIFLWIISTCLFFFGDVRWTYLSIILFWALPPIIIQLLFGADILWHYRKLVFWGIVAPATYLSLTDMLALKETTWSISPGQSTGVLLFGILPVEEALFFFITNVLLTFGMTLLLANASQQRFTELKNLMRAWKEKLTVNPQVR